MVVYLLFSRYRPISCSNFWHVSSIHVLAIDFRRGRACPLNRAVYSTPHSVWSVYRVSIVDRVISTVYPL